MDCQKAYESGGDSPPPLYTDLITTQPDLKAAHDSLIPFHGHHLTFEETKAQFGDTYHMLPLHSVFGMQKDLELVAGGNIRAIYRRANTKLDEFDVVLYRQFRIPPQMVIGNADDAYKECTRQDFLRRVFSTLDVPICHHIRLNMPEVTAAIDRGCHVSATTTDRDANSTYHNTLPPEFAQEGHKDGSILKCGTGLWKHTQKCAACDHMGVDTALGFRTLIDEVNSGRRCLVWLSLDVTVVLGTLQCSTDPAWLLHSFSQEESLRATCSWKRWCDAYYDERALVWPKLGWPKPDRRNGELEWRLTKHTVQGPSWANTLQQVRDISQAPPSCVIQ